MVPRHKWDALWNQIIPYSIAEENHAAAKAVFLQKLKLQSNIVWEGLFAASHYDW